MFKRNASVSQIEFARPLMLPSEINRLPQNQELILVNGMYPILADKLRYYDDKRYQAKVLAPMKLERQAAKLAITQINEPVSAVVSPQAIGSAL